MSKSAMMAAQQHDRALIRALEARLAALEARLAAVEARPVQAPVIQPWSPNRPYVQPGDGTSRPYPSLPWVTVNS